MNIESSSMSAGSGNAIAPSSHAAANSQARSRADWVDAARGVVMSFVVIGHAIAGLYAAGVLTGSFPWDEVHHYLGTFRMPAFALLSGLFVQRRLLKGRSSFVTACVQKIAWPYMLWSTVQLLIIGMLGSLVNAPYEFSWTRIPLLLIEPASQFWFLQALFLFHLTAIWIVPSFGAKTLLYLGFGVLLVNQVFLGSSLAPEQPPITFYYADLAWYYALGVWLGAALPKVRLSRLDAGLAMIVAWAAWFLFTHAISGQLSSGWQAPVILSSVAGIIACLCTAQWAAAGGDKILPFLGRNSMAILVLHVLFVAGLRIVLTRGLGWTEPVSLLGVCIAGGLLGPLCIKALADRFGVSKLVGLG
jgi:fucose 4-O-acetylase-like acetyltransferase